MFITVADSFAVTKFVITVTTFSFLNIASLTTIESTYAIGFNLTNFRADRDRTIDSSTHSTQLTIQSDNISTGNIISSVEEFLSTRPEDFEAISPNNIYVANTTKLLSVNSGSVLTLKYDFTKTINDDSFVTIGTKIFPLANATDNDIHLYTFAPTDRENSSIGSLDIDDSTSSSTLDITNTQLPNYNFEVSSSLLFFGGLFFGKRYLRKLKENNTADEIKQQSNIRSKPKGN